MLADFKDSSGLWVRSFGGRANPQKTLSGQVWTNMTQRCRPGSAFQTNHPSYAGCTTSLLFSDFQSFTDWHVRQIGYALPGYDLDKDLLGDGKLYSENNCLLIPHRLNTFFKSTTSSGVYKDQRRENYYSNITVDGKARRLGTYKTEQDAAAAFKKAKHTEAQVWLHKLKAGHYIIDPRAITRIEFLLDKEEF